MIKIITLILISMLSSQNIPHFNGNRSMELLIEQCDIGPRYPESEGHLLMKKYLKNFLNPISDSLYVMDEKIPHPYKRHYITLTNYLARFNLEASYRIMFMAHWDTREVADLDPDINNRTLPILGANDGASGVAVLLTLAEILSKNILINIGVDILLVDGEDMGHSGDPDKFGLGTQAFSKHVPEPRPQYAICVDMVGDQEPSFPIEQFSLKQAPELVEKIWSLAQSLGYNEFENRIGSAIMDDHYYLYKYSKIPAIDIIDFDYPNKNINYWHTLQDIPENCSAKSLEIVGTVITHFVYIEDSKFKK